MPARAKERTANPAISPPLPLPTKFTLLPSLLPGRNLVPLLYVEINDLPIYLTLSPTHQPHLSLLPLVLSVHLVPPIHLFSSGLLDLGDISLDLDGNAPFADIWVPIDIARRVFAKLGIGRLFWDEKLGRGLLGKGMDRAMSWEEGDGFWHNWVPDKRYLPKSAYSLNKLLGTPFLGIDLIGDDRCVCTALDPPRRAELMGQDPSDSSSMRTREWGGACESLIRWSILAWEEFMRYPSKPKADVKPHESEINTLLALIHHLIPILPTLSTPSCKLSFSPNLADLQTLFSSTYTSKPTPSLWSRFSPFQRADDTITLAELEQKRVQARLNLSTVELVGWVMINSYRSERENRKLREMLDGHGEEIVRDIVFVREVIPVCEDEVEVIDDRDDVRVLERKRGSSPPPRPIPSPNEIKRTRTSESVPSSQSRHEIGDVLHRDKIRNDVTLHVLTEMLSERTEGWWMYLCFVAVGLMGWCLGSLGGV